MTDRSAGPSGEPRLDRAAPDEGAGPSDLARRVGSVLGRRGVTLALAESCTGGMIAARLTDLPGASSYLLGGVVAYANSVKKNVLGVRTKTLAAYGAVSEAVAREMALGARDRLGADAAVAVTGIAGPGGGSPTKPVGTVWIAAVFGDEVRARHCLFDGDRAEIRERAVDAALALLLEVLESAAEGGAEVGR